MMGSGNPRFDMQSARKRIRWANLFVVLTMLLLMVAFSIGLALAVLEVRTVTEEIRDCTVPGSVCYENRTASTDRAVSRVQDILERIDGENDLTRAEIRSLIEQHLDERTC